MRAIVGLNTNDGLEIQKHLLIAITIVALSKSYKLRFSGPDKRRLLSSRVREDSTSDRTERMSYTSTSPVRVWRG